MIHRQHRRPLGTVKINKVNLSKMKFKEEGGYFFQNKPTDGRVVKITRCGSLKYPLVLRWLYKERQTDCISLDMRYFQKVEPLVYIQSKNGIRIYDYINDRYWLPNVVKTFNDMYKLYTPHSTHLGEYWCELEGVDGIWLTDEYKESKYGKDYSIEEVRKKVNPFWG